MYATHCLNGVHVPDTPFHGGKDLCQIILQSPYPVQSYSPDKNHGRVIVYARDTQSHSGENFCQVI